MNMQELVNKSVREAQKTRKVEHWQASSLGNCPTGLYLERLGNKPDAPFDDRTLRVFSIGNVFEDWLLNLLEKQGVTLERQTALVDEKLDLAGHPDAIVTKGAEKVVYELKTIHSRGFWHMAREKKSGYDHHRLQLWCYLYMTNIEKGNLVYMSKDDLAINEYSVFLNDEKLKAEATKVLDALNEAWVTKTPPEPAPEGSWQAKYCGFHKQCLEA